MSSPSDPEGTVTVTLKLSAFWGKLVEQSAPYVLVNIPFANKSFRTNVGSGSQPKWTVDESLVFKIQPGAYMNRDFLEIKVMEKSVFADKLCGTAKIDLETILVGPEQYDLSLTHPDGRQRGSIGFRAVATTTCNTRLWVRNVRCDTLRPMRNEAGADAPYNVQVVISCTIRGSKVRLQTPVAHDSAQPYWALLPTVNVPNISLPDLLGLNFDIAVYNVDLTRGGNADLIGVARLFIAQLFSPVPNDYVFFRQNIFFEQKPAGCVEGYFVMTAAPLRAQMVVAPGSDCRDAVYVGRGDASFIEGAGVLHMALPVPPVPVRPAVTHAVFPTAPRMYPPPHFVPPAPGAPTAADVIAALLNDLRVGDDDRKLTALRRLSDLADGNMPACEEIHDRRAPLDVHQLLAKSPLSDMRMEACRLIYVLTKNERNRDAFWAIALKEVIAAARSSDLGLQEFAVGALANLASDNSDTQKHLRKSENAMDIFKAALKVDVTATQQHALRGIGWLCYGSDGEQLDMGTVRLLQRKLDASNPPATIKWALFALQHCGLHAGRRAVVEEMVPSIPRQDMKQTTVVVAYIEFVTFLTTATAGLAKGKSLAAVFALNDACALLDWLVMCRATAPAMVQSAAMCALKSLSVDEPVPVMSAIIRGLSKHTETEERVALLEVLDVIARRLGSDDKSIRSVLDVKMRVEDLAGCLSADPQVADRVLAIMVLFFASSSAGLPVAYDALVPRLMKLLENEKTASSAVTALIDVGIAKSSRVRFGVLERLPRMLAGSAMQRGLAIGLLQRAVKSDRSLLRSAGNVLTALAERLDEFGEVLVPLLTSVPLDSKSMSLLVNTVSRMASQSTDAVAAANAQRVLFGIVSAEPTAWAYLEDRASVVRMLDSGGDAAEAVLRCLRELVEKGGPKGDGLWLRFLADALGSANPQAPVLAAKALARAADDKKITARAMEDIGNALLSHLVHGKPEVRVLLLDALSEQFVTEELRGLFQRAEGASAVVVTMLRTHAVSASVLLASVARRSEYDLLNDLIAAGLLPELVELLSPSQSRGASVYENAINITTELLHSRFREVTAQALRLRDMVSLCLHPAAGVAGASVTALQALLAAQPDLREAVHRDGLAVWLLDVLGSVQEASKPFVLSALAIIGQEEASAEQLRVQLMAAPHRVGALMAAMSLTVCSRAAKQLSSALRLNSQVCTFLSTGERYTLQPRFQCLTCGLSDSAGVCAACAKQCHSGHRVVATGTSNTFCYCGRSGLCLCMSPIRPSGGASDDTIHRCSFNLTGPTPRSQDWFTCSTCHPGRPNVAVCTECSVACHAGHMLKSVGTSPCYCDCGTQATCKCNH